jgi:DNA-binding response OmpR family regulator
MSKRGAIDLPCRLLVIEDEFLISELIADQLHELNLAVAGTATTVAQALHLIETVEIDAALLDMRLDEKFSGEVADALGREGIPFLFVSGYSSVPDPRFRHVPILLKPFETSELQAALRGVLPPQCLPEPGVALSA